MEELQGDNSNPALQSSSLGDSFRLDLARIDGYLKIWASPIESDEGVRLFETHLPTEPTTARQDARFSRAHEYARWPSDPEAPAPEGPPSPDSMTVNVDEASHSFPKYLRLLRRIEFRRVYEEGRRRRAPLCTVFYRRTDCRTAAWALPLQGLWGNRCFAIG